MTERWVSVDMTRAWLPLWTPRILSLLAALFFGAFALGSLGEGLAATLRHATPALLLPATKAAAWRWPWVGGVVFIGAAVRYAALVRGRTSWILTIKGPLLTVGLLFFLSSIDRKGAARRSAT
jgi:hypothetical protein